MFHAISGALSDFRGGLRLRRVWLALAQEDISDQHRRTALGPAWLLVNYLLFVGTFLIVFNSSTTPPNFPAYISLGMLVFLYIQEIVLQGVSLFTRERSLIAGTPLPLSVYIFRLTFQCLIRTGYAALGCLAILLIVGTPVTAMWIWSAFGIVVLVAMTPPIILICATTGAFFPDLQFIIVNVMRIAMFLSPIFWMTAVGPRGELYKWNPLTYFIGIVRDPIVVGRPSVFSFEICLEISIASWLISMLLLAKFRKQIIFVL